MQQINFACTAEINGEWYAVDVIAEHQSAEKQTWNDPGCAEELTITTIFYVDPSRGMFEELEESEWTEELLAYLDDECAAFMKRRKNNDELDRALFCADLEDI